MVAENVVAMATALLGGFIAAGATMLGLFWRMGQAAGSSDENPNPNGATTNQRIDDLRGYLEGKFDTVDRRFETMQDQLDRRFDSVEGRIDTVDEEVAKLESRVDEFETN